MNRRQFIYLQCVTIVFAMGCSTNLKKFHVIEGGCEGSLNKCNSQLHHLAQNVEDMAHECYYDYDVIRSGFFKKSTIKSVKYEVEDGFIVRLESYELK